MTYKQKTLYLIIFVAFLNIIYNANFPIHFDETYYWAMSKHPQLCYFDIPPMLSYMIAFFTFFSDNVVFIRLVSVFSVAISMLYLYKLSYIIYKNQKHSFVLVAILLSLPVTELGFTITTTDAPFMLFFSASMYYGYKALFFRQTKDFVKLGFSIGFGAISKYTTILIPAILILFALLYKRDVFKSIKPYVSAFIVFLIFLPVLIWNYNLDFEPIIFRYKFGSSSGYDISLNYLLDYLGGNMILFTPVFFVFFIYYLLKYKTLNTSEKFLVFSTILFLMYFLYKALFKQMALNWYAPAIFIGMVFVVNNMQKDGFKKGIKIGFFVSISLMLLVKFPDFFGLQKDTNSKSRVMGWKEATERFDKITPKNSLICTDYYSSSSMLNYYLKDRRGKIIEAFSPDRKSDYDYWYDLDSFNGKGCYLFFKGKMNQKERNLRHNVKLLETFEYNHPPYSKRKFYFYKCDMLTLRVTTPTTYQGAK